MRRLHQHGVTRRDDEATVPAGRFGCRSSKIECFSAAPNPPNCLRSRSRWYSKVSMIFADSACSSMCPCIESLKTLVRSLKAFVAAIFNKLPDEQTVGHVGVWWRRGLHTRSSNCPEGESNYGYHQLVSSHPLRHTKSCTEQN